MNEFTELAIVQLVSLANIPLMASIGAKETTSHHCHVPKRACLSVRCRQHHFNSSYKLHCTTLHHRSLPRSAYKLLWQRSIKGVFSSIPYHQHSYYYVRVREHRTTVVNAFSLCSSSTNVLRLIRLVGQLKIKILRMTLWANCPFSLVANQQLTIAVFAKDLCRICLLTIDF